LGFTGPNPLASSLRHGRSGTIAVLVEGRLRLAFRDPFVISVLDGLAEVLDSIPSGLLLLGEPEDDPDAVLPQVAGLALDAVVFSLCGPGSPAVVEHCAARGIPMFATGAPEDPRITQIRLDERRAGAEIASHVQALGHHRVATVTLPLSPGGAGPATDEALRTATSVPARGRLHGFRDVFGPSAVAVQTATGSSVEGGLQAGRALLDVPALERPTAIVAQSDVLAAGVILAAEELGLTVPADLSVTGFDGVDLPWLPHRLTTMDQHGYDKGRRLGLLVQQALQGERPDDVAQPADLRVGTTTARAR
jgi:DNA-binding LacI/PurR family transcriptional regulator